MTTKTELEWKATSETRQESADGRFAIETNPLLPDMYLLTDRKHFAGLHNSLESAKAHAFNRVRSG